MTARLLALAGLFAALSSGCTAAYVGPATPVTYYGPPVYAARWYGPHVHYYGAPRVYERVYVAPVRMRRATVFESRHAFSPRMGRAPMRHASGEWRGRGRW